MAKRARVAPVHLALLAAALLLASALPAVTVRAQVKVPANDGWVTDLANMLTPQQESQLETLMESYKRGSGHEIALLTVPELGGQPIERYALEVSRQWGLGEKEKNNGALLLVASAEREIRIEVGRGLEGNITDGISGRIIRGIISPQFKQGNFYEGLRNGIQALHAAAGGDYAQIPRERRRTSRGGGIGLIPLLFMIFILMRLFRGGRSGRGGGGGALLGGLLLGSMLGGAGRSSGGGFGGGGFSGGGFGGFGGGGGFSGGGASGGW